ncbi:MAG TPA: TonB family protein [Pyrinomonadaceae bacterium]|nr:TonB family protein [Pyrinomonadaceae bacterium]
MSRLATKISLFGICLLAFSPVVWGQTGATARARNAPQPVAESDRSRDGLIGPVRRIRTEVAKLSTQDGKQVESKHIVLEIVAYDVKGNKIENQYFPIAGATLTGKEVYKYDEKGNISEMTLVNNDGTLLSKEIYKYEYDFAGNWNRMTTSVAVIDSGRISFEPSEITYRSIMYYLDEAMVKMVISPGAQPTTPTNSNPSAAPANTNTSAPAANPVTNSSVSQAPEQKQTPKNSAKQGDARKNNPAPATVLPTANTSSARLTTSGSVEAKTVAVNPDSSVPMVNLGDEPPPSPASKPIKPVSGGVLNGTALVLPPPAYPESAKRMKIQGVVTVEVVLDETGKVISANATDGPQMLRDAAVLAAKRARFSPTKLSGMPVKVSGVINYKFALLQ